MPTATEFSAPLDPSIGFTAARRRSRFDVIARGDTRTFVGAAVVGVAFAVAAHQAVTTLAAACFVTLLALCLLAGGRLHSWSSRVLVAVVPLLSLALVLRSSPWVIVPVVLAIGGLFGLAATFANAPVLRASFPQLVARLGVVFDQTVLAPGMLKSDTPEDRGAVRARLIALVRGAALAIPVVIVIGALLGSADPLFRSWFDPSRTTTNLALVVIGAWTLVGLTRAASAKEPTALLRPSPSLGTVEVVSVLGALSALYAAFVASQVATLLRGEEHVLTTSGLTFADYARAGFFQLLAAASITLVVLLGLRACADRSRLSVLVVSEATIALTLIVVAVALARLGLYQDKYGFTMLRLASSVTAVWIGVVFLLVAGAVARRDKPTDWLAPAVVLSGVAFVALWALCNPAAVVADRNLDRAATGKTFDIDEALSLGPDAVPTLVEGLPILGRKDSARLSTHLCLQQESAEFGPAFNASRTRAAEGVEAWCESGDDA